MTSEKQVFNTAISSSSVRVKQSYKDIKQYWVNQESARNMKIFQSPVPLLHRFYKIILNVHDCLNKSEQVIDIFHVTPPSLEMYLQVISVSLFISALKGCNCSPCSRFVCSRYSFLVATALLFESKPFHPSTRDFYPRVCFFRHAWTLSCNAMLLYRHSWNVTFKAYPPISSLSQSLSSTRYVSYPSLTTLLWFYYLLWESPPCDQLS